MGGKKTRKTVDLAKGSIRKLGWGRKVRNKETEIEKIGGKGQKSSRDGTELSER